MLYGELDEIGLLERHTAREHAAFEWASTTSQKHGVALLCGRLVVLRL